MILGAESALDGFVEGILTGSDPWVVVLFGHSDALMAQQNANRLN
jgi:hypothetical protein